MLNGPGILRGMLLRSLKRIGGRGSLVVESGVRVSRGTLICGHGVHIGRHSEIVGRVRLDDEVFVHPHVLLRAQGGFICIGERSTVNPFTTVYGAGGVTVGQQVSIAAHVSIVAEAKRYEDPTTPIKQQGANRRGIVIEDDVWIGAHAVILDGVRVGRGAVIAAGAVVTKDVDHLSVVAGVPAISIRVRDALSRRCRAECPSSNGNVGDREPGG